ncbi:MAG: alkaline phytoceramidase [Gallionella sp.]|nr:alkaline phytoceramidase [Gallionella sp.]
MKLSRKSRAGLLLACAAAVAFAVALLPPFPQPQDYHRFADARALFGVPNFLDVVSNLAFLAVAVAGLAAVLRPSSFAGSAAFIDSAERLPYALFFLALAATAFGSAWYHLAPDHARLFWDRLPISVCFAALLSAVIAERYSTRAGRMLLPPLAAAGAGTVCYWLWSETRGAGNVLPYFAFQAYALFAILLLMRLFPPRYSRSADLYRAVMLYGAALAVELFDRSVFALGEIIGGHTLKHLLAALAIYQVVRMLRLRTRV